MVKVSVIVPTFNRLDQLKHVIAGLEKQIVPVTTFEVIVVSDGARDGTNEYVQRLQTPLRLVLVLQENQGAAAARNRGVAQACGEIVLFLDDDVVPAPSLVAEHMHTHAQYGENVVVLGPMLTPPDFGMAPWVRWEQAMLEKQYADMSLGHWQPTARQFYTGNASLARHHLAAVGGFDTAFRRAEDVELAYRLASYGMQFVFNSAAVGLHYAQRSFASWLTTPYLYGRNDVVFTRSKGQTWLLPTISQEFQERHSFIRYLTRVCLSRRIVSASVLAGLVGAARLGNLLGWRRLAFAAYSCIFNLRHYQGIADELGGRQQFEEWIVQAMDAAPRGLVS